MSLRGSAWQVSLAVLALCGCATTQAAAVSDDDDAPAEVENIVSTSVRIQRGKKGPATAEIERGSEVSEVLRVVNLLGAAGAKKVRLRVEGGVEAEVITAPPKGQPLWLVVAVTDGGFKVFVASNAEVKKGKAAAKEADYPPIPPREGKPDWEALAATVRAVAAATPKLGGTSVAAPAQARADHVVETLQRLAAVLGGKRPSLLVAW